MKLTEKIQMKAIGYTFTIGELYNNDSISVMVNEPDKKKALKKVIDLIEYGLPLIKRNYDEMV